MLFSFWDRPWVKKTIIGIYWFLIVFSSITFCYWTFRVDVGSDLNTIKPSAKKEFQIQTSCRTEIEKARLAFEKDMSPENWRTWSNLEIGCKP